MKAQISFVEFLVSLTVFIVFVGYFSTQIVNTVPVYLNQLRTESLRAEAFQVSEMLVNDPGYPINWPTSGAVRIGFSDETRNQTNYLSLQKIQAIGPNCAPGYNTLTSLIGAAYNFSLTIINDTNGNGGVLLSCSPSSIVARQVNVTIKRYVFFGSGYGELILQMW